MYRRTDMKQVKIHRTELSLSVSEAESHALSKNEGPSLQTLQGILDVSEQLNQERVETY